MLFFMVLYVFPVTAGECFFGGCSVEIKHTLNADVRSLAVRALQQHRKAIGSIPSAEHIVDDE